MGIRSGMESKKTACEDIKKARKSLFSLGLIELFESTPSRSRTLDPLIKSLKGFENNLFVIN